MINLINPEYIAGLADSDGSFTISRTVRRTNQPTFSARFSVHWKQHPNALDVFQYLKNKFGGVIGQVKNKDTFYFTYSITDKYMDYFLQEVGPFVILKREQVQLLLKLRSTIKRGGGTRSKELIQKREEMFLEMKRLNKGFQGNSILEEII